MEKEIGITLDQGRSTPLFVCGDVANFGGGAILGKLCMEVDTGSDRTIINRKVCTELGLVIRNFKEPRKIIGVGGVNICCKYYTVFRLHLGISLYILSYVLEGAPSLLGSDVLFHVHSSIDMTRDNISSH